MRVSRVCFGTGSDGRSLRCAPFLIVSLGLRINPANKSFDVCFDKWCHSLENIKKFGTNLAGLYAVVDPPQSQSRIDSPFGRSLELVHEWGPHCHSNRVKALSLPSSQDS